MKNNLLKVVQLYLDYVDGFQVDSIWDSDESSQAAQIAEHVYYTIVDKNRDTLPTTKQLRKLYPSNDPNVPNMLIIPDEVTRVWNAQIRYNGRLVRWMNPDEFMKYMQPRTPHQSIEEEVKYDDVSFTIRNDKDPDYCTSFDDNRLVFDSYDKSKDTVLQADKTSVISYEHPVFLLEDEFLIPLPDRMQSGYVDVVVNECCEALRDIQKPSVARRANAFLAKMQQTQGTVGNNSSVQKRYGRR